MIRLRTASAAALAIACSAAVAACSGDRPAAKPLAPGERAVIARALERALDDSAAIAHTSFDLPVRMETSIVESDRSVRVVETFRLRKRSGSDFVVAGRQQQIIGERSLLGSMYSFENSKGDLRSESGAQLTSVGFGADQRTILRDLLAGSLSLVRAGDARDGDGSATRTLAFAGEGIDGALTLDPATLAARHIRVRRTSSSIIGGYVYTMDLALAAPSELRMPVEMTTGFHFDRLASSGSGSVRMRIDTNRTTTAKGVIDGLRHAQGELLGRAPALQPRLQR
jgi:hypothetical protein